ncbi:hypothetical protein ACX0G7_10610 [Flavitalea antarctica]
MKQYFISVAGYDFANGGVNFPFIADKRRLDLLSRNPSWQNDADVIFVRMDVKAGTIERNISNGSTRNWTVESSGFTPISRGNHYSGNHFKSADTSVMSITDCYRYVSNIGASEPGTVKEFGILGHGWFGGPVLVNSFQRSQYEANGAEASLRDPWDKDGRTKDFFTQNMNDADWQNFRRAFASDGYCWVWGCLFSRAYFDTLYKIMQTSAFRNKQMGNHADTDTFTIAVNATFVSNYYHVDPLFFPASRSELSFTRSLADIKKFLKRGIRRSYPGRFTADTAIECRAAYLGTYSDYERVHAGHSVRHTVMVIPRHMGAYGCDFTRTINFFKTYLNQQEDPESRGYAIYNSAQINAWWADTR